jgi:aryl sulfotransferase
MKTSSMREPDFDWGRSYVIPASVRFRPTPSGGLRVEDGGVEDDVEVPRDCVILLLAFGEARTADAAYAAATEDWEIDRESFRKLLQRWIAQGLLGVPDTSPHASSAEPRAGMVWIASYPRSGNTWLRFLLSAYFLGAACDSREMEERIPNLHRGNIDKAWAHDPVLGKTHLLWNERHPHLGASRGCIYLIRHPKDVLLSNLNYFKLQGEAVDDRAFALDFIESGGAPWSREELGSWEEHASSWLKSSPLPRLVIRYEDMKEKPQAALSRVIQFLGLQPDPEKIARAVRDCELPRLRQLETEERRAQRSTLFPAGFEQLEPGRFFFHLGGVGQDLSHLGDDLDELFDRRFGDSLRWLDTAERL